MQIVPKIDCEFCRSHYNIRMTHRKPPGTIEFAIAQVVSELGGADVVSKLLGVGRSTVDSWKNPGRGAKPSLETVIAMEVEYANATDEPSPTPIIAALMASVELQRKHSPPVRLLDEVLRLRTYVDEISSLVLTQARLERLEQPLDLSTDERLQIQRTLTEAMTRIAVLDNSLRTFNESPTSFRTAVSYSITTQRPSQTRVGWWSRLRNSLNKKR